MNFTDELSASAHPVSNNTNYIPVSIYILSIIYPINAILGLPLHSYVLWLICMGKGSGIVAEFFSLNLAVCEILFCLGCVIFIATFKFPALLYTTFMMLIPPAVGRPLINCVICIERYLAVIHPVFFLKCKPLRYRLACSAVIWVMVLGFGMFYNFILASKNMYLFFWFSVLLYSILLLIKYFCCLAVFKSLRDSGPGKNRKEREEANRIKRKAMIVILIISGTMFIQYTPVYVLAIFYLSQSVAQFDLYWSIGVVLWILTAYVSPFHYLYRVRNL